MSYVLKPARVLFRSKMKNTAILMTKIIIVVYNAIFVFRLYMCTGLIPFCRPLIQFQALLTYSKKTSLKLTNIGNPIAPAITIILTTIYMDWFEFIRAGLAMPPGRFEKPALQNADHGVECRKCNLVM